MNIELEKKVNELIFDGKLRDYVSCGKKYICDCPSDDCICMMSERIDRAWEVVLELGRRGFDYDIVCKGKTREYAFTSEVTVFKHGVFMVGHAVGPVAEAICEAAIQAVNADIKELYGVDEDVFEDE